jgi:hypothetical protein
MSTAVHNHTQRSSVLDAAHSLPWQAFFCIKSRDPRKNKTPACPRGFHAACQGDALDDLFRRYPGGLIGVPTGPASGFSVLDIDMPKGGDVWLNENRARLPQTRMHETQSGGAHFLFKHKAGLKCSTSKIAAGVDVRAEGGYIIYWPADGYGFVDHPLADWPTWLTPPEPEPLPRSPAPAPFNGGTGYGAVALDDACSKIAGAANGDQERTLNRESYSIGSLVAGGVIERSEAMDALLKAARSMPAYNSNWPWTVREVDRKVERSFEAGQRRPRTPVRRAGS